MMAISWMNDELDQSFNIDLKNDCGNPEFLDKLMALSILMEIPFPYLIPSETALPDDSIKFFHLDQKWIFSLLDGAISLGRNISYDHKIDQQIIEDVLSKAVLRSNQIRPMLQGKQTPENLTNFNCTGFLLRSALVKDYRGLEFQAFSNDKKITALRIETIKDDVLLAIFPEKISKLEILQPPEGLHFGFNREINGQMSKKLRSLENGELIEDKQIQLYERSNRVLNITECVADIKSKLNLKDITSAHLALEMIQNAYKIEIEIIDKEVSCG